MTQFALNHITAKRLGVAGLAALARDIGLASVELRNDIAGEPLADGTPAGAVAGMLDGVAAASVNALQRFNDWSDVRAAEADALAAATAAVGAPALVLCPVNVAGWSCSADDLRTALRELAPILRAHGLTGLVEPLGFSICSLRYKRDAVAAIDASGDPGAYRLLHDTFHHAIARDPDLFPDRTGLVHVSGVSDPAVSLEDMRDAHRVLVDADDRLDNVGQIAALSAGGFDGLFSIECFADCVADDPALADNIIASLRYIAAG